MGVREFLEQKKKEMEEKLRLPEKRAFLAWTEKILATGNSAIIFFDGGGPELYVKNTKGLSKAKNSHINATQLRLVMGGFCQTHFILTFGVMRLCMCSLAGQDFFIG